MRKKELILFVVSLLFIVGMVVVVAQNTNWLSFAYTRDRMMQFCLNRGFSGENCEKLMNRKLGITGNAEVDAWCGSECGGGKEGKICKQVCGEVNTGTTCQAACGKYQGSPPMYKACAQRCPSLVMPTPTP